MATRTWKQANEVGRLIYLIGGPPRCGKTIIARRLQQILGCSYVPSDYLGAAISRYIPDDQREARLPAVGSGTRNDERFRRFSAAQMLAGFQMRARTAWPGLQAFIEYALSEGQGYVIEGFHIEPDFARQLSDTYGGHNLRVGFLIKTDLEAIVTGLQDARVPNDWARGRTDDPATFRLIAAWIQRYSEYIRDEADRHAFPTFATDTAFEQSIATALHYFTDAMDVPDER